MEYKLTVFWIEDNPIQSNVQRVNSKQYPKFLHEEFITYYLFQHPKQVEEYLSMINVLKNTTHSLAEQCQNALPDIVAFDYKMADAFNNNQDALSYYDNDHRTYLQSKSVSHKLKEIFEEQFKSQTLFLDREDVKNLEYGGDGFAKEIKASKIQLDDEFGLYCGIAIVREFKEYITVGVPATINKADKAGTMSYNSLFYEWINSYDLKGAIDRPAKADEMKDWSKILSFSVDHLRKRIVSQIKTGKATPDYSQLNALAEGNIPEERVFSFETIYGKRNLPIDGLFIDKSEVIESQSKEDFIQFVRQKKKALEELNTKKGKLENSINTDKKTMEEKTKLKKQLKETLSLLSETQRKIEHLENFSKTERNLEIWRFANVILSELPFGIPVINRAIETATTLWETYVTEFEDRIVLSDYISRSGLTSIEKTYLKEVKARLGVNATGLIASECSIQTLLSDEENNNTVRLTALIVVTRAAIELEKQRVESNFNEKYPPLMPDEYFNVLFPKANLGKAGSKTVRLPMNFSNKEEKDDAMDSAKKWLMRRLSALESQVKQADIFQFEKWILKGEKEILKSFFYKDSSYYPYWLK